jgi:hypothetical protein
MCRVSTRKRRENFLLPKRIQFLSNFALLLEEVGSQTVGSPYRYQYEQLTLQHGLKMDENSLHPTFQESLAVGLNLKICHLKIKGISASKSDYLSRLMRDSHCCHPGNTHNFRFEYSEQRQTTRIQIDWRYSKHRKVLQRYFDGPAPSFVGGCRFVKNLDVDL